MPLDYATYQGVIASNSTTIPAYNEWYKHSYPIFLNQPFNTIEDLWKIVAFAYSWMPRIPKLHLDQLQVPQQQLLQALQNLKQGTETDITWLFETLVPVINNSVVGTSKVLHFIAPDQVPIYDSRVAAAWRSLFPVGDPFHLDRIQGDKNKVLHYIQHMKTWCENCQTAGASISLRDLEFALYQYSQTQVS